MLQEGGVQPLPGGVQLPAAIADRAKPPIAKPTMVDIRASLDDFMVVMCVIIGSVSC